MSGLELAAFALGVLGPLEQSINIFKCIKNHFKSYKAIVSIINQLIPSSTHLHDELKRLEAQLKRCNKSIPPDNYQTFKTILTNIESLFWKVHESLSEMKNEAGNTLKRSVKATKWEEECKSFQSQINDAQHKLLQITSFLGQNAANTSNTTELKQEIRQVPQQVVQQVVKTMQLHEASSSTSRPPDKFKGYFQKLLVSHAAIANYDSLDSHGIPLTTEGKLKKLLCDSQEHHTKIFAVQGPGGVGKTTCMHMLSHNQQLRKYFVDGIYYMKLGADAKADNAAKEMIDIIHDTGGVKKIREIKNPNSIDEVMKSASEWFRDKKFLFLVDDVWERKKVGSLLLSLFKRMLSESNEGGMVFTTRDPTIATEAVKALVINYRNPQDPESRAILFRHAGQNSEKKYSEAAEESIKALLKTCGGIPMAHSVVGKVVKRYSMMQNVEEEDAWLMYARRQQNILHGTGDDYDPLHTVLKAAVCFLEEEELENGDLKGNSYCYAEMHRSLCVLEKQQWAPVEMLGCMWSIKSEEVVRGICENLVRVGLAEWHVEIVPNDQEKDIEGISIHDLLHEFAFEEAAENNEIGKWHTRVVEGYENQMQIEKVNGDKCRQWWTIVERRNKGDRGYLMRNIFRHLYHGLFKKKEIAMLVTRPEWIGAQLSINGLLQYERDVVYACEWMEEREESSSVQNLGVKEMKMVRDAVRLSAPCIRKNSHEVWFQLYSRLMRPGKKLETMKRYLLWIEGNAPRPWLKPVDGLLTSVGSGMKNVIDVGDLIRCMVVLPDDGGILCGCDNGDVLVVDLKESKEKRWKAHNAPVDDVTISPSGKIVASFSKDGTGKIWKTENWDLIQTFGGANAKQTVIKISRDEKHVFRIARRKRDGIVQIWNIESGCCVYISKTAFFLSVMTLLKDEDRIVTNGSGKTLLVWKIEKHIFDSQGYKEANAFGMELNRGEEINVHSTPNCMAVNDDGSTMVIGFEDGSVQLWNANTMNPIREPWTGHTAWVSCISVSNDGSKVATGSRDGTIQVWDMNTQELLCPPLTRRPVQLESLKGVSFDKMVSFVEQDENLVATSGGTVLRTWKLGESAPEARLEEIPENVISLSCSPDQSSFFLRTEQGIQIRDAETGQIKDELGPSSSEDLQRAIETAPIVKDTDENSIFCIRHKRGVRYGNESNSVVLGTLGSPIEHYAYSSLHQVVAIYPFATLTFLKVVH